MNNAKRALLIVPALVVTGGLLIAAVNAWLAPRIEARQRQAAAAIYFDVLQLPRASDISLRDTMTDDPALGLRASQKIIVAYRQGIAVGAVLPLTAREGYGGDIDLLLGIDSAGKVTAVRAIAHNETRNLGAAIDRDNSRWLEQFRDKTFDEPEAANWQLRRDGGASDGITGATVTSRAVIDAVREGLKYFAAHRAELMREPINE